MICTYFNIFILVFDLLLFYWSERFQQELAINMFKLPIYKFDLAFYILKPFYIFSRICFY